MYVVSMELAVGGLKVIGVGWGESGKGGGGGGGEVGRDISGGWWAG